MSWFSEYLGIPGILILIGALAGAVGVILVNIESSRKQLEIAELNKKIAEKSEKIAELNEKIAGSVTGGDSFCYLFPTVSRSKLNTIDFHLSKMGTYPIYDLTIKIWDESCLNKIDHGHLFEKHLGYINKEVTLEEGLKMQKDPEFIRKTKEINNELIELMRKCLIVNEKIGTLSHTSTNVMDPPMFRFNVPQGVDPNKFSQKYQVNIAARNGQYNQNIILDIRSKRIHVYSKVEKIISDTQRDVVREYESLDSDVFAIHLIK